jgi:tryptophanyl-tRNA synthetase
LSLYSLFTQKSLAEVCLEFEGKQFSEFKPKLASTLIDHLSPIRSTMHKLLADEASLLQYLKKGADAANAIACKNMREIRQTLNMV